MFDISRFLSSLDGMILLSLNRSWTTPPGPRGCDSQEDDCAKRVGRDAHPPLTHLAQKARNGVEKCCQAYLLSGAEGRRVLECGSGLGYRRLEEIGLHKNGKKLGEKECFIR